MKKSKPTKASGKVAVAKKLSVKSAVKAAAKPEVKTSVKTAAKSGVKSQAKAAVKPQTKVPAVKPSAQKVTASKTTGVKPTSAKTSVKAGAKAVTKPAAAVAKPSSKAPANQAAVSTKPAKSLEPSSNKPGKNAVKGALSKAAAADGTSSQVAAKAATKPSAKPAAKVEARVEPRVVIPEEPDTAEDVVLTDADGRRYCRTKDCDRLAEVDNYCRYHYILLWKNIQIRRNILQEGKLGRYIEELTARYPDKFLEILKKDLRSEKDFLAAIQELEIDESAVEAEFDDEESQADLFEIQRVSDSGNAGDRSDSDDRF